MCALTRRRIFERVLQRVCLAPLVLGTNAAVHSDAVEPPIDFEVMSIGIEELHCDLDTGAATAFEHDRHGMLAQALASEKDFVKRTHLERKMVQLALLRRS
jgi:hypothetical protein